MIVTIANRSLSQKPLTKREKDIYWGGIIFNTFNIKLEDFREIISNGQTLTYQYKDPTFKRGTGYQANYYLGTQFICVDVDKQDVDAHTFVSKLKYKPTIYHTTFWNKTEYKDNKWCFHLIYVLDRTIYGERNFREFFNIFSKDYDDAVDKEAKDCHRCIYTSNSSLEHFQYDDKGQIYSVDEICREYSIELDDPKDFSNVIEDKEKLDRKQLIDFKLDDTVFKIMMSNPWSSYLTYFEFNGYPHYTHSVYDDEMYKDSNGNYKGYADLRDVPYYVVPTAQYRWDSKLNKPVIDRIMPGHRSTMLKIDAIAFMKIIPNITKEYLVISLIREFYQHFDNSDKKYNTMKIIEFARDAWNNVDRFNLNPIKRTFIIDYEYWYNKGNTNWRSVAGIIRSLIKSSDLLDLYDMSITFEANFEYLKSIGKVKDKRTLKKHLDKNGIEYITEKELIKSKVINMYYEDNTRSYRDIAKELDISHHTVKSILDKIN